MLFLADAEIIGCVFVESECGFMLYQGLQDTRKDYAG